MKTETKVFKITLAAVFAALIFVATAFLQIPLPGSGYANLGDSIILSASLALGPVYGAAAAAIGAGFSDIFLGFGIYAPATIVIKALMSIAAFYVYRAVMGKGEKRLLGATISAAVASEIIMVSGYFLFEIPMYGMGVALIDTVGNGLQGAVGVIAGTAIYCALKKSGALKNMK